MPRFIATLLAPRAYHCDCIGLGLQGRDVLDCRPCL
jgi:hypothetical protein